MNGRIIDISPVINSQLAVWPGDVPFSRELNLSIADGANIDLSAIRGTVHLGAHTDAPSHYAANGEGIAQRICPSIWGRHRSSRSTSSVGAAFGRGRPRRDYAPRVLFKTGVPRPHRLQHGLLCPLPSLIEKLAGEGSASWHRTPSIDRESKDLLVTRCWLPTSRFSRASCSTKWTTVCTH